MNFDIYEWLIIAARWIHVFAGIMWVGQTYFFTWLDGRFTEMFQKPGGAGADNHVWMVHSGGFYTVGKQKKPQIMPGTPQHSFRGCKPLDARGWHLHHQYSYYGSRLNQ